MGDCIALRERYGGAALSCGLHRIERLMRSQALKARPRRRRLRPQATAPILDSTRLCKKAWYRHCRRTSLAFARLNAIPGIRSV